MWGWDIKLSKSEHEYLCVNDKRCYRCRHLLVFCHTTPQGQKICTITSCKCTRHADGS